jgi:hypothetical protein
MILKILVLILHIESKLCEKYQDFDIMVKKKLIFYNFYWFSLFKAYLAKNGYVQDIAQVKTTNNQTRGKFHPFVDLKKERELALERMIM